MTDILIRTPSYAQDEIQYVLSVLLDDFLGIKYEIQTSNENKIVFQHDNRFLEFATEFFQIASKHWLHSLSLPVQPLSLWNAGELGLDIKLVNPKIPILYGNSTSEISKNSIKLGVDLFGSVFFMLTRYEEVVRTSKDSHDRFTAQYSLALQEGFLDRPIVNEYLEILWSCMKYLWPKLKRKSRVFRMHVSCDVDVPYSLGTSSMSRQLIQIAGDLIKRKSFYHANINWKNYWSIKRGDYSNDPNNTFDWIMDICESISVKCAFYFICDHGGTIDGIYSMDESFIRKLLNRIHSRGHEIGLHASYYSYLSSGQISKEFDILKSVCSQEGIMQNQWGSRQHILRWRTPETFSYLDQAGLDYDTTLSFADHAGFRCGVCYEYQTYDLKKRTSLRLRERPLVIMECSVISQRYMALGYSENMIEFMQLLKSRCKMFGGDFTLLWHNSQLTTNIDKKYYQAILEV